MGRVDAFRLPGIDCWFWSYDHYPPHFNAKRRGEWQVKVFFMSSREKMLVRVRGLQGRVAARHRNALCAMAEQHRAELLAEWEAKVHHE